MYRRSHNKIGRKGRNMKKVDPTPKGRAEGSGGIPQLWGDSPLKSFGPKTQVELSSQEHQSWKEVFT